jgi:hypothetical protein
MKLVVPGQVTMDTRSRKARPERLAPVGEAANDDKEQNNIPVMGFATLAPHSR